MENVINAVEEKVQENLTEVATENLEMEEIVADAVIDAADAAPSKFASILAGILTVFGIIGIISTIKKIKSKISEWKQKRAEKKAAKAKKPAPADASEYLTEEDVQKQMEEESETEE